MANWAQMARRAAIRAGIDPDVFEPQMRHESAGYDEDVIYGRRASSAGALGIAQIMPETAKGWKVNPLNPQAALKRAAQAMREYVDQFGNYEDALRAYNAGPGAVDKSREYSETNKYVQIILGGKQPKAPGKQSRLTSLFDQNDASTNEQDNPVARLRDIFSRMPQPQPLTVNPSTDPYGFGAKINENLQRSSQLLQSIRDNRTQEPVQRALPQVGNIPTGNGQWKGLKEIFWQGPGGFNWDEGSVQPMGYVSGHGLRGENPHAHIAAGPKNVQRLINLANDMNVPVTSTTEGEHAPGSWHYKNRALDVGGSTAQIRKFVTRVRNLFGV